MAFNSIVLAALERMGLYNGNPYNETTNPLGFAARGYKVNWSKSLNDMGLVSQAVAEEAADAAESAAEAAVSAEASETDRAAGAVILTQNQSLRDQCQTFRDQAASSAAATQYPVTNSGGTATAYTATLSGFALTDGASFRLNVHTPNGAGPTLNVNSTGAKALVAPDLLPLVSGELTSGETAIVYYEQTSDRWVVVNLPRRKLALDLNANGKKIVNQRDKRQVLYRAELAPQEDLELIVFETATRVHGLTTRLRAGAADLVLYKNTTALTFGSSTAVAASTSLATYTPAGGHIDFVAGDVLLMDIQGVTGARTLSGMLDTTENYQP